MRKKTNPRRLKPTHSPLFPRIRADAPRIQAFRVQGLGKVNIVAPYTCTVPLSSWNPPHNLGPVQTPSRGVFSAEHKTGTELRAVLVKKKDLKRIREHKRLANAHARAQTLSIRSAGAAGCVWNVRICVCAAGECPSVCMRDNR